MDAFLAGDDLPAKKPDPSIYVLAAERMGLQPEQCLVIEDSAIGLQVSMHSVQKSEHGLVELQVPSSVPLFVCYQDETAYYTLQVKSTAAPFAFWLTLHSSILSAVMHTDLTCSCCDGHLLP